MVPVKQVIVVRKDLRMSKGKMAAQVSHASLGALFMAMGIGKFAGSKEGETIQIKVETGSPLDYWLNTSFTKVVLEVSSEEELMMIVHELKNQDFIPYSLIEDEGRTEFDKPTITCLGIGPAYSEVINVLTGHLKLYKDEEADFYLKRRIKELEDELEQKEIFIDAICTSIKEIKVSK